MKTTERQELQKKSLARVSKWPNTVTAMREKKEADRIKVLEEQEVSFQFHLLQFWLLLLLRYLSVILL